MFTLQTYILSTRQGRVGPAIATWFADAARQHGKFNIELVDLAEVNLPLFDEPKHPRLRQYAHAHTRAWSEIVQRADAFVFVTPEYNYGAPQSLINALDYLNQEWVYKPVVFVSYGGVSAGTRSVQMTKQIVTTLKMMPIPEAVSIPFFTQFINMGNGTFQPDKVQVEAAGVMLDELLEWTSALEPLRADSAELITRA